MDANENCATPQSAETEVRKLQEIVRKLELQNAELRKGQGGYDGKKFGPNGVIPVNRLLSTADSEPDDEDDQQELLNDSTLDEIDLIDVEQLELSDEDSWLYESPTSLTPEQKAISPYKWLRTDVDDLSNTELQAVKRALVSKIEGLIQASIVNRNQAQPTFKTNITYADRNAEPCLRMPLCARLSLGSNAQSIDTRTFTRPKKSLKAVDLPVVDSVFESPPKFEKRAPTPPPLPSLTDVSDIHTMARLQEECLRQSSPPPSSRRNSVASTSSQRSAKSLATDHDTHDATLGNKIMHTSTGTDSQHEESPRALSGQSSAASSSPPISPHSSQYIEETRNATSGIVKRALPNLPRPYNGVYSSPRGSIGQTTAHASNVVASNCDTRPVNDQALRTQRYSSPLRKVGGIPRSSSPATRLSSFPVRKSSPQIEDGVATATASPASSNATVAGGGVGGLASRIPKPRQTRSAIPMRATAYGRTVAEESWKDGCY